MDVTIQVRVNEGLRDALKVLAEQEKRTMSNLIRLALEEWSAAKMPIAAKQ